MKILIVEPGRAPYRAKIEDRLEIMQFIVGGHIEAVMPFSDAVVLVCNEEGMLLELPFNRMVRWDMPIFGTFFLCGVGEEDFADLPDEMAEKYERELAREWLGEANETKKSDLPVCASQGS